MNCSNSLANKAKWTKFSMRLIESTWENQSLTLTQEKYTKITEK